ncbi:MAG: bifunctional phosphoserine phosphatase/homoserine phosphotransferase ThrH [Spirochaetales bacterium]|jgi:phosphoserine / homoserine phosphotransferase|nr:bifunctional phosphoserine phosphatase/homoserine phosphotransferase ThrH [Spirochaetales bacterium]
MHLVCLDLEGVLVPEIWIAFSKAAGIEELAVTTRDIPDYHKLMKHRLAHLAFHKITLPDIQKVIADLDPLEGAAELLDKLRNITQVIILSDTFTQFAGPLMKKLGWPTLFCNTLIINESGAVSDYQLRIKDGKKASVEAFTSVGYKVIAAGDSYNDISMLKAADAGFLFRPPLKIAEEFPEFPSIDNHIDLYNKITEYLES